MSYTFSWSSLLPTQWIDNTSLYSAMLGFNFYSKDVDNNISSIPNFDITSNHFLTKENANNYIYNPEYTSTGIGKSMSQYIARQDLVIASLTYSVFTGFSSPSVMLYNPNDELIYVADLDAGNINSSVYSNIYSFSPYQLGTGSSTFSLPGSSTGITLSFYGTVSAGVYLNDFSYSCVTDEDNGLLYLTGYDNTSGDGDEYPAVSLYGGLRIFDVNTHELITIPYGVNQANCRQSMTVLSNKILLQSRKKNLSGAETVAYIMNKPVSGLTTLLKNQLNGLKSSLKEINYQTDTINYNVIANAAASTVEVKNSLGNSYLCIIGAQSKVCSINMGIYNINPVGNTFSLYSVYKGTNSINTNTHGTSSFVTKIFKPGDTSFDGYARGLFFDKNNFRLYMPDLGASCINIIDASKDPKLWTTIATIYINSTSETSSLSLTQNLGLTSSYYINSQVSFFTNPNNGFIQAGVVSIYSVSHPAVYLSLNVINPTITYTELVTNPNNLFTDKHDGLFVSNFISAQGVNLYGCNAGVSGWTGEVNRYKDGTFTKYGLNITGTK